MRRLLCATTLASLSIAAAAQDNAQADIAGSTPIVVAPDALSTGQLTEIKRALGVTSSTRIGRDDDQS